MAGAGTRAEELFEQYMHSTTVSAGQHGVVVVIEKKGRQDARESVQDAREREVQTREAAEAERQWRRIRVLYVCGTKGARTGTARRAWAVAESAGMWAMRG